MGVVWQLFGVDHKRIFYGPPDDSTGGSEQWPLGFSAENQSVL